MARGPLAFAFSRIRRLAGHEVEASTPDGQLLERFAILHEQAAFAALMERHGPMVLAVCRRVLNDEHAAEDAFQATFLVLVRRAGALAKRGLVAGWLYTVAFHMALRVRARSARQRAREIEVREMTQVEVPTTSGSAADLRLILDAELDRLPEKYRAPIILCYLQGKTNDEAAELLGWTRGTVAGRLSRARDLLRDRLARRGLALTAGGFAMAVSEAVASAAVPTALFETTGNAAMLFLTSSGAGVPAGIVALVNGMLRSLWLARLRFAAALLLLVGLGGAGMALAVQQLTKAGAAAPAPVESADLVYLVDLPEANLNIPAAEYFAKGGMVKGVASVRKLSLHPPTNGMSSVTYQLDKKYRRFQAEVGIRDHSHGRRRTPLTFIVLGDGRELWQSQPLHEPGVTDKCHIDIEGVVQLELQVRCPGASVYAWAAWVDPRVSK